jgi:putative endonuclease
MTSNLSFRLWEHEAGVDPECYTFRRRPVRLAWCAPFGNHNEAFLAEHQIKGWSRAKKEALIHDGLQAVHGVVREERRRRESRSRIRKRQ